MSLQITRRGFLGATAAGGAALFTDRKEKSSSVPSNPTIKITFDGLLVFAFNEARQSCEIGVIKAEPHVLRVTHAIKDAELMFTTYELAKELELNDIRIEIPGRTDGVSIYEGTHQEDPEDFRWLPDLEGPEFHNRKLPLKPGFPQQRVILRQGLFYSSKIIPAMLVSPNEPRKRIKIANPVGCNFYLKEGEKFVLSYGLAGQKLEIIATANITHELTILNTPRKSQEHVHSQKLTTAEDRALHFPHFYEEAVEVPAEEHFNIESAITSFGDPNFPCPGIRLGKHPEGLPYTSTS